MPGKYGTVNWKRLERSIHSKTLEEAAEKAREKRGKGEELTWKEEWLLRNER